MCDSKECNTNLKYRKVKCEANRIKNWAMSTKYASCTSSRLYFPRPFQDLTSYGELWSVGHLKPPFLECRTFVYFTWPEPLPRMFFDGVWGLLELYLDLWRWLAFQCSRRLRRGLLSCLVLGLFWGPWCWLKP